MSHTATIVPQLLTPRQASIRTRLPWQILRTELEARGSRIIKLAGRERVDAADLAALIEAGTQPTAAESASRIDLAIEQAAEEMGITRRRRTRGRAS